MEPTFVETTDVGKSIMEEELKVATEEITCDAPAASLDTMGKWIDALFDTERKALLYSF